MSDKKIIAILGATGAQGGGLADAILSDPNSPFSVRAITRDVNSDKAKALAARGAELVAADVDNEADLVRAFTGAYGAFCVTFFWAHMDPQKELDEAAAMARATKAAGVQHVIWSTLEDTRKFVPLSDDRMPTLGGKYKVPHFDAKGEANQFFINAGVPLTLMNTAFYWDNFIYFGMGPQKGPDGKYAITLPMADKRLPGIAAVDIGRCAYGIFKGGAQYIGKTVGIAGGTPTGQEMASTLSKVLGTEIGYNALPPAVYRSFGFPGADDLGNMFQFKSEFEKEYVGSRDLALSKALNPELQSFEQWATNNASRIPLK